jgi:hypothetical protein
MAKQYKSGPQVYVGVEGRIKAKQSQEHRDFAKMLKHPTIKLCIDVVTAMAMKEPWVIECEDDDIAEYTYNQFEPYREKWIRSAIRGFIIDGWRLFETLNDIAATDKLGLKQTLAGVKPLKPENITILVNPDTGDFAGALFKGKDKQTETFIDPRHLTWINQDDDGYGEFGEELLNSVWLPWHKWELSEEGAQRYDEKVAGGFLHITCPTGVTPFGGSLEPTRNELIAKQMAESFKASGYAITPIDVFDPQTGQVLPQVLEAWKVNYISTAGNMQPSFVSREKYLDALMLRCFGLPERSVTEGTFGTKAEAEAHADIAMLVNSERHKRIVADISTQALKEFNLANWGDAGITRLTVGKLDPESRALFGTIFTALMADPMLGDSVAGQVDVAALLDKLQVPVKVEESFAVEI